MTMDNPKKDEQPLSEQEFVKKLEDFIKEHGFKMVVDLKYIPTNHGTFELSAQIAVVRDNAIS